MRLLQEVDLHNNGVDDGAVHDVNTLSIHVLFQIEGYYQLLIQ